MTEPLFDRAMLATVPRWDTIDALIGCAAYPHADQLDRFRALFSQMRAEQTGDHAARIRCIRSLLHNFSYDVCNESLACARSLDMMRVVLRALYANVEGVQFAAACLLDSALWTYRSTDGTPAYRVMEDGLGSLQQAKTLSRALAIEIEANVAKIVQCVQPVLLRGVSVHVLALIGFRSLMAQLADPCACMHNALMSGRCPQREHPRNIRRDVGDERLIDSSVPVLAASSSHVAAYAKQWDKSLDLRRLQVARMATAVLQARMDLFLARHIASFIYVRDPAKHSYEVMGGRAQIGETAEQALVRTHRAT